MNKNINPGLISRIAGGVVAVSLMMALSASQAKADPLGNAQPPTTPPHPIASLRIPHCEVERDYATRMSKDVYYLADMYKLFNLKFRVVDGNSKLRVSAQVVLYNCGKNEEKRTYEWQRDDSRLKYYDMVLVGEGAKRLPWKRIWVSDAERVDERTGDVSVEIPIDWILTGENRERFRNHENIENLAIVAVASGDKFVGHGYSRTNQLSTEGLRVTFDLVYDREHGYSPRFRH